MQESTENEEMADQTNLPAPGETAAFATFLLLRRVGGEFRVKLLVGFQELFVLGIERQRNGLLGLEKIHGG